MNKQANGGKVKNPVPNLIVGVETKGDECSPVEQILSLFEAHRNYFLNIFNKFIKHKGFIWKIVDDIVQEEL